MSKTLFCIFHSLVFIAICLFDVVMLNATEHLGYPHKLLAGAFVALYAIVAFVYLARYILIYRDRYANKACKVQAD